MPTFGEVAEEYQRRLFTGRERELDVFGGWLVEPRPSILNVVGHGGVGKTALLKQFAGLGEAAGFAVRLVDGRVVAGRVEALHRALGGHDVDSAVAAVNAGPTLLLIDTFEETAGLTRHLLTRLVPRFDVATRLVVAGRYPLLASDAGEAAWPGMVRRVTMTAFSPAESRRYLRARGVVAEAAIEDALRSCGGNPLALTLAADLMSDLGVPEVSAVGDWPTVIRELTERLLRHITDQGVRDLLDAAATVRQFDPDVLAAVSGRPAGEHLDALVQLAMLRPAEWGLQLHDDVRRILLADLQRNRPERRAELRERALDYFAQRMAGATPDEAQDLINERLYLWEHALIHSVLFTDDDPGRVFVEEYDATHRAAVLSLWDAFAELSVPAAGAPAVLDLDRAGIERLLDSPTNRTLVARRADGKLLAVGPLAEATPESIAFLPAVAQEAARAHLGSDRLLWMGPVVSSDEDAPASASALIRALMRIWARGGVFFTATRLPGYSQILQTFGFTSTPVAGDVDRLVLVLPPSAVDDWMRTIIDRLPPASAESDDSGDRIEVRTLGRFEVIRGGADVTPPHGMPGRALKVVVAFGGSVHAERVAEALWPHVDPERGRARLHNVLSRVRDRCGPVIVRDGAILRLPPNVTVDALSFRQEVEQALSLKVQGRPEAERYARAAVQRYGGDIFPGEPFADWAAGVREGLRQLLLAAIEIMADAAEERCELDEAVELLQRAVEVERYDEARYLRVARLLRRQGRHAAAARSLQRARAMLDDLGLPASPELIELEDALRAG